MRKNVKFQTSERFNFQNNNLLKFFFVPSLLIHCKIDMIQKKKKIEKLEWYFYILYHNKNPS